MEGHAATALQRHEPRRHTAHTSLLNPHAWHSTTAAATLRSLESGHAAAGEAVSSLRSMQCTTNAIRANPVYLPVESGAQNPTPGPAQPLIQAAARPHRRTRADSSRGRPQRGGWPGRAGQPPPTCVLALDWLPRRRRPRLLLPLPSAAGCVTACTGPVPSSCTARK